MMDIMDLRDIHLGLSIWIVGKGPSLRYLTPDHFPRRGVVLCLNDSLRVIRRFNLTNPLYSMQKDGDPEYMVKPGADVTLLLQEPLSGSGYSSEWFPAHMKKVIISPVVELGFQYEEATATEMAISIAKLMGCIFIHMICCDILTTDDGRTINTWTGLSEMDDYKHSIYAHAKLRIMDDLKSIAHDFVVPEAL